MIVCCDQPCDNRKKYTNETSMRIILFLLTSIVALMPLSAKAAKPVVMIVNSYHESLAWVQNHNSVLTERLKEQADLAYFYLDSKRQPEKVYTRTAEACWQKFKDIKPDIVVLTDDDALRLLGKRITETGTPIIFLGINQNPRIYLGEMKMATGVLERPLYKRSLMYFENMLPHPIRKCLILFDDGSMSKLIMQLAFNNRTSQEIIGIPTDIRLIGQLDQWKKQVREAKKNGYDIIFIGICHSIFDSSGNHVSSEEIMRWTSANSEVPPFGYWKFAVGKGKMVGGLVHSGKSQGEIAAELVSRVIDGESPSNIYPVTAKYGDFLFSRHEIDRWNINIEKINSTIKKPVQFVD